MSLKDNIMCTKTDCLSYGTKVQCYSTLRLQDEHCKLYLRESELLRLGLHGKKKLEVRA